MYPTGYIDENEIGLMTTFRQNFSADYKSGDAVIFWKYEETAGDDDDMFLLKEIIRL